MRHHSDDTSHPAAGFSFLTRGGSRVLRKSLIPKCRAVQPTDQEPAAERRKLSVDISFEYPKYTIIQ